MRELAKPRRSPTIELIANDQRATLTRRNGNRVNILTKTALFGSASGFSYIALTAVFTLYCLFVGHNFTEAIYGGFFAFALAPAFGAELTLYFVERLAGRV